MKKTLTGLLFVIAFLLAACGRKSVEYDIDTNLETDMIQEESQGIPGTSGSLAERLGAEEFWDEELATEQGNTIRIYAQVKIPDTSGAKVYSAEERYYSAEEIQTFCETVSEGEIYYADPEYLPKAELAKQIAQMQYFADLDSGTDWEEFYLEQVDLLQGLYNQASDDYTVATDFSTEKHLNYLLTYKGVDYEISFPTWEEGKISYIKMGPYNGDYKDTLGRDVSGERDAVQIVRMLGAEEIIYPEDSAYARENNDCGISINQANEIAGDFLEQLRLEGFQPVEYKKARWALVEPLDDGGLTTDFKGEFFDGMVLTCYRGIDNMVVDGDDYSLVKSFQTTQSGEQIGEGNPDNENFGNENYGMEKIEICVSKNGVMDFTYYNPVRLQEVVAGDVTMLDYETALSAMRQEILTHYDSRERLPYSELELMYFRCKGEKEGEYRILPAWRLIARNSAGEIEQTRMINAIDGSYIDVGDELFY